MGGHPGDVCARVGGRGRHRARPMPRRGCPQHGADYGLCQIYGNEPWHYELRPDAVDRGCPPTYADPTQDPRTQQGT